MANPLKIFRSRQEEPMETICWPALREVQVGSQTQGPESGVFATRDSFIRSEKPALSEGAITTGSSASQAVSNSQANTNTFGNAQEKAPEIDRLADRVIVRVPYPSPPPSRFELLQQWEGEVRQIEADEFTAVIRDLTNPCSPEEEITLPKDEISSGDIGLVQPGAIFYWIIGYRISPDGQKTRTSDLRFRRLPAWSAKEINRATDHTYEFKRMLGIG